MILFTITIISPIKIKATPTPSSLLQSAWRGEKTINVNKEDQPAGLRTQDILISANVQFTEEIFMFFLPLRTDLD